MRLDKILLLNSNFVASEQFESTKLSSDKIIRPVVSRFWLMTVSHVKFLAKVHVCRHAEPPVCQISDVVVKRLKVMML